jgi:hypothetical protein
MIIFNACAPAYIPNVINAPLLNNKNEAQLGGYYGVSGLDGQFNYAITNKFGLMLNASYSNRTSDTNSNYHKHSFVEGGFGYYSNNKSKAHFEVFTGFGYGISDIKADGLFGSEIISKNTFTRIFFQPDFGYSSEIFDLSFTPRFVLVNMKPEYYQFSSISCLLVEPVGTLRFGFRYFYFTSQIGLSFPLMSVNDQSWFQYQPIIFNIGIMIKLGKIYDASPTY